VTQTEKAIQELGLTIATLQERLDNARAEIIRGDSERSKTTASLNEITLKFVVIEENVKELKKIAEEKDRRRWTVVLAAVGCLLTLAANVGLTYFRLNK
jgi:hypothetical protein